MINKRQLSRLVLTNRDRLLRFGSELIFDMCKMHDIEVITLDDDKELSKENELARDVIELMTVFSAKLYGQRSHQNLRRLKTHIDLT